MLHFEVKPLTIKIWYRGKYVPAHEVSHLPRTIKVKPTGDGVYIHYWEEGGNREDPRVGKWRCYHDLWSAYRGIRLAQAGALWRRLPLLQELHARCVHAHLTLTDVDHRTPQTLQEVQAFVRSFLALIRAPKTHALQEALQRLEKVHLRDRLGRLNPGAAATNLWPVKDRLLPERQRDIITWLPHYARWERQVELLLELCGWVLKELPRYLNAWSVNLTQIDGRAVAHLTRQVQKLAAFPGWSAWAKQCMYDLQTMQRVVTDRRVRVSAVAAALGRLKLSVRVKALHREISDLMLDMALAQLEGRFPRRAFQDRLKSLTDRVGELDDTILRQPVGRELRRILVEARDQLDVPAHPVKKIRDRLREAGNLL